MKAKSVRLTRWEWLDVLGTLSGLVMLAAGQVLDHAGLAWAALAALVLGYVGRLVTQRREAREDPTQARRPDRDRVVGCAALGALVAVAMCLVAGLVGLLVALFRDTPLWAGAWTGVRIVMMLAAAVSALLIFEYFVTRRAP